VASTRVTGYDNGLGCVPGGHELSVGENSWEKSDENGPEPQVYGSAKFSAHHP